MNPSTASHRLLRDILWSLVQKSGRDTCYQCSAKMTRQSFSIEHKEPWLDSEDPVGIYFDLDNISFSHLACNIKASRTPHKKYHTVEEKRTGGAERQKLWWTSLSKEEQQSRRKIKYEKYKC